MHWLYLFIAIAFEIAGTTALKLSAGFTQPLFTGLVFVCYGVSFALIARALTVLPVSVAYAIWSAVGTAMIAVIGVIWFGESLNAIKLGSLLLIIIGVIGLRVSH